MHSGIRKKMHYFHDSPTQAREIYRFKRFLRQKVFWSFIPPNKKIGSFGHHGAGKKSPLGVFREIRGLQKSLLCSHGTWMVARSVPHWAIRRRRNDRCTYTIATFVHGGVLLLFFSKNCLIVSAKRQFFLHDLIIDSSQLRSAAQPDEFTFLKKKSLPKCINLWSGEWELLFRTFFPNNF